MSRPARSPARERPSRKPTCKICSSRHRKVTILSAKEVSYGHQLCNSCYDWDRYEQEDTPASYEEKLGPALRHVFCYQKPMWVKVVALCCMAIRPAVLTYSKMGEPPPAPPQVS